MNWSEPLKRKKEVGLRELLCSSINYDGRHKKRLELRGEKIESNDR